MIAPPPPTTAKPLAFFDTECSPNYWLLKFRVRGGPRFVFELHEGQTFSPSDSHRISILFASFTVVGFNSKHYDMPMIASAMKGYNPQQLKWQNDRIIVEKIKPWNLGLGEYDAPDHIDIIEVCPGRETQKQYAARIHCKTIQDLPYEPSHILSPEEKIQVSAYCDVDIDCLEALYDHLQPQIRLRENLSKRYGIDLRSKSDAQLAETVLKVRCEIATGRDIYKPYLDPKMSFRFECPSFISFQLPHLLQAKQIVEEAIFQFDHNAKLELPPKLDNLLIPVGGTVYKLGIGGLHSQDESTTYLSDDQYQLLDVDVESYYPSLIINSGKYPPALGPAFCDEYVKMKAERVENKVLEKKLKDLGDTSSELYEDAHAGNDGGKIMVNGAFGKTNNAYYKNGRLTGSVLLAPQMLIQTTMPGQLSLLMLIEWHELNGIPVVSANTDGIVVKCPRDKIHVHKWLVAEWEKRTNLKMEATEYRAIYSRDVNNYIAITNDGKVKRKGEYAKSGLMEKKNPDCEICSDAVVEFLAKGVPIEYTIASCRDIRKFITMTKVAGGGVKLWGEGPRKGTKVVDMTATLLANGWVKEGRKWRKNDSVTDATTAYHACFAPQREEYLGKTVRWYYGTNSPGPIVYASNGNNVSLSYGACPCMTLPDQFPDNVDYQWYIKKSYSILVDIGK